MFLEFHLDQFLDDYAHYSEDKMLKIIRRTWKKMSTVGHQAALELAFSTAASDWVQKALKL